MDALRTPPDGQREGADISFHSTETSSRQTTPETGPNAFAQQQVMTHRQRLASNAFYQAEYAKRKNTPPTMVHPAFRRDVNIMDPHQPIPELDQAEVAQHLAQQKQRTGKISTVDAFSEREQAAIPQVPLGNIQRASEMTTMSPFLTADQQSSPSPVLNLGTTPEITPQPTQRAWIEDQREAQQYERSGTSGERIPVFEHTPKLGVEDFSTAHEMYQESKGTPSQQASPSTKSPKRRFLERFRLTGKRSATSTAQVASTAEDEEIPDMSVKARAVLVRAPLKRGVERSPSKSTGLFSRHSTNAKENTPSYSRSPERREAPRATTSLGGRTPHNVKFQLPGLSKGSQIQTSQAKTGLGRSRSLKYLDHTVPPTPPAKDTPPDEIGMRSTSQRTKEAATHVDYTPSRSFGHFSHHIRRNSVRLGDRSDRSPAQLVTKPSMYSMRASIVPEAMGAPEFDDVKSRLDGLGIEGFNDPAECTRSNENCEYSPSIYSPDNFRHSVGTFSVRVASRINHRSTAEYEMQKKQVGAAKSDNTSDSGTIVIQYPDLAKDPSIADFMSPNIGHDYSTTRPGEIEQAFGDVEKKVQETVDIPTTPRSEAPNEGLFAIEPRPRSSRLPATPHTPDMNSISSPLSQHPSARPSPLRDPSGHEYLPTTTYNLPHAKARRSSISTPQLNVIEENKSAESLLTPKDDPWTPSGRPRPKSSIFDHKPDLHVRKRSLVVRQSPPRGGEDWTKQDRSKGDPEKSEAPYPPPSRGLPPTPTPHLRDNAKALAAETMTPKKKSKNTEAEPWVKNIVDIVSQFDRERERKAYELEREREEVIQELLERDRKREELFNELDRKVTAENALVDQRVASLEIRDQLPKPDIVYGYEESVHETGRSSKRSGLHKGSGKTRSPEKMEKRHMKRVSTEYAREYYQKPQGVTDDEALGVKELAAENISPAISVPEAEKSATLLSQDDSMDRGGGVPLASVSPPTASNVAPAPAASPTPEVAKDHSSAVGNTAGLESSEFDTLTLIKFRQMLDLMIQSRKDGSEGS